MKKLNLDETNSIKTKKFYKKYLQKSCGLTAANFSQMHTQVEWKEMEKKNVFIQNILQTCPKSSDTVAKILIHKNGKKAFNDLLQFSIRYAKGTGNFPPC